MKIRYPIFFFLSLFLFFVTVGGAFYCYYNLSQPPENPAIVVEPSVIDFGNIERETRLAGTATVTNRSKKSVIIGDVFSSCACSGILLNKGELPPGKSVKLTVFMDTHGRHGQTHAELIVTFVPVGQTSKGTRFLTLNLHADVVIPPEVEK
jgi:hypothetical protein